MTESEILTYFGPAPDKAVIRRRWRFFLVADGIAFLCFVLLSSLVLYWRIDWEWFPYVFAIGCLWFVNTLPICFLYLIGRPPVMSLSPLISSWQSRAFARLLRDRPALSDDEFHATYFDGSNAPREIPTRLRTCLLALDARIDRIIPSDSLALLHDELDFADVLRIVTREFQIGFTSVDYSQMDGTFGNLVDLVCVRIPS
jgi:hypothetical protein